MCKFYLYLASKYSNLNPENINTFTMKCSFYKLLLNVLLKEENPNKEVFECLYLSSVLYQLEK